VGIAIIKREKNTVNPICTERERGVFTTGEAITIIG